MDYPCLSYAAVFRILPDSGVDPLFAMKMPESPSFNILAGRDCKHQCLDFQWKNQVELEAKVTQLCNLMSMEKQWQYQAALRLRQAADLKQRSLQQQYQKLRLQNQSSSQMVLRQLQQKNKLLSAELSQKDDCINKKQASILAEKSQFRLKAEKQTRQMQQLKDSHKKQLNQLNRKIAQFSSRLIQSEQKYKDDFGLRAKELQRQTTKIKQQLSQSKVQIQVLTTRLADSSNQANKRQEECRAHRKQNNSLSVQLSQSRQAYECEIQKIRKDCQRKLNENLALAESNYIEQARESRRLVQSRLNQQYKSQLQELSRKFQDQIEDQQQIIRKHKSQLKQLQQDYKFKTSRLKEDVQLELKKKLDKEKDQLRAGYEMQLQVQQRRIAELEQTIDINLQQHSRELLNLRCESKQAQSNCQQQQRSFQQNLQQLEQMKFTIVQLKNQLKCKEDQARKQQSAYKVNSQAQLRQQQQVLEKIKREYELKLKAADDRLRSTLYEKEQRVKSQAQQQQIKLVQQRERINLELQKLRGQLRQKQQLLKTMDCRQKQFNKKIEACLKKIDQLQRNQRLLSKERTTQDKLQLALRQLEVQLKSKCMECEQYRDELSRKCRLIQELQKNHQRLNCEFSSSKTVQDEQTRRFKQMYERAQQALRLKRVQVQNVAKQFQAYRRQSEQIKYQHSEKDKSKRQQYQTYQCRIREYELRFCQISRQREQSQSEIARLKELLKKLKQANAEQSQKMQLASRLYESKMQQLNGAVEEYKSRSSALEQQCRQLVAEKSAQCNKTSKHIMVTKRVTVQQRKKEGSLQKK